MVLNLGLRIKYIIKWTSSQKIAIHLSHQPTIHFMNPQISQILNCDDGVPELSKSWKFLHVIFIMLFELILKQIFWTLDKGYHGTIKIFYHIFLPVCFISWFYFLLFMNLLGLVFMHNVLLLFYFLFKKYHLLRMKILYSMLIDKILRNIRKLYLLIIIKFLYIFLIYYI